jgi:superfamily II DNA or RNA helicase
MTAWRLGQRPRRWQSAALSDWQMNGRRGIAQVVTGAGKTIFAELCLLDFLETAPDGRIVIVVPTLALLDQWYADLQEDLGVAPEEIAIYSGEGRPIEPAKINLLVLNTARTEAPGLSADAPTLLVVDECHRAGSPENAKALTGEHTATLGLSATPERQYDKALAEVLEPALGDIFVTYDYAQAGRDGVITEFSLVNVGVDLLPKEQERYDAMSRQIGKVLREVRAGQADEDKLKVHLRRRAMVSVRAARRVPAAAWLADQHRGRRTVIFHEEIAAAERIYELLAKRHHNVTLYHSKIAAPVRRDNLRLFRRGAFQVLVSCRALDEGVNVPETEVGIIASSTASTRQRIQRLGRVLRPAPGKDHATVYTLYATEIEERRLAKEAERIEAASSVRWQKARVGRA